MKKLFKSMIAGAALFAFANLASAVPTYIYMTGSTAFRVAAVTEIKNAMTAPITIAYDSVSGSSETKSNYCIIHGTINTIDTIVKCSWSGSAKGMENVNQGVSATFFTDSALPASGTTAGVAIVTPAPSSNAELDVTNVAMSDVYATSDTYASPAISLTDNIVGIIPFQFVTTANAPAAMSNINPNVAQATWLYAATGGPGTSGTASAMLYTGNAADKTTIVYATGRDIDSGTRIDALSETAIGAGTLVNQYNISSGNPNYTPDGTLYAAGTVNGHSVGLGNNGEPSGGNLADKMKGPLGGKVFVTYLGIGDALRAIDQDGSAPKLTGAAAKTMTYNGVPYTLANLENGSYTFWSYEHLMYKSSLAGSQLTVTQAIITKMQATATDVFTMVPGPGTTSRWVSVGDVNLLVGRNGDGLPVIY